MIKYLPIMEAVGDHFKVKSIVQDITFSKMGEYVMFNVEFDPDVNLKPLLESFPPKNLHQALKAEIDVKKNNKGTIKLFTPPIILNR